MVALRARLATVDEVFIRGTDKLPPLDLDSARLNIQRIDGQVIFEVIVDYASEARLSAANEKGAE